MSEELLQTIPKKIGRYTYYRLGSTTLQQLKKAGIVPRKNYGELKNKKPDGLVSYHGDVKAVIEYKQPKDLRTEKQIEKAIKQEIRVAKKLCKLLIVTDGNKSRWINALNGDYIEDQNGNTITTVFHPFGSGDMTAIEHLIEDVDASISETSSRIRSAELIDPSLLANRLWQTIWVATGKSPVKCLYNVVELFIFKFLSDLEVLPEDMAFGRVYDKAKADHEESLKYYAKNSRERIYELFPAGEDGTTIINGTIFVNETNQPNLSQSILFQRCLKHLSDHSQEFGSLTKISKQFKTRLYESFLNQEVEALGQYFTPRKLIQSMIRMAGIDQPSFPFTGKRICDPFCGLGGFLVEILNMNDLMMTAYSPNEGQISLPFSLSGFDKGFERDDERTIILAKANMLIYLTQILFRNPQLAKEFSRVFNETFTLYRDNLGTFGHIIDDEDEKFDIIMSNPPYVTSGSSIIKEEIAKTPHTANAYPINGLGLESLSLEWIVKSLKKGGRAYIVIPDGILSRVHGKKLRDHLLHECYLDAIVSLPVRTFFANSERTYIIVLTKKQDVTDLQDHAVFTYLVSDIGERLTSVHREEIDEDDLPDMERLFRIFDATKATSVEIESNLRCKAQPIKRFRKEPHWLVDRWWTTEEMSLLAKEHNETATKADVDLAVKDLTDALNGFEPVTNSSTVPAKHVKKVHLGDESLFQTFIGKRFLKKNLTAEGNIPVYSANVSNPMGYAEATRINDFSRPSILWGIDGNFNFNLIPKDIDFDTTDHCGALRILDPNICSEYVLFALHQHKLHESYGRSFRASLFYVRRIEIDVPITESGTFDVTTQEEIAKQFFLLREKTAEIADIKNRLNIRIDSYLKEGALHGFEG